MSKRGARWIAQQSGDKTYISDVPCKNGHMSERLTTTGTCLQCRRDRELFRYRNDEEFRNYQLEKSKKNPEHKAKITREWRNRQSPEKREKMRADIRENGKRIRRERPKERLFYSAQHRAAKLQRTPLWANKDAIKQIYKNCPVGMHVDHIVPLRAELASGLHVENNLQYLSAKENISKLNRFEPYFMSVEAINEVKAFWKNLTHGIQD